MVNRSLRPTCLHAALAGVLLLAGSPALADGPGPELPYGAGADPYVRARPAIEAETRRPPRRVTGGPGYVGSEWGLGKPSYYGIGPRPDWGRSSSD